MVLRKWRGILTIRRRDLEGLFPRYMKGTHGLGGLRIVRFAGVGERYLLGPVT